jgi:hypothetical protein
MGEKAHFKSVIISSFLAFMALSATASNLALGLTYKAIDLTPSGSNHSHVYGTSGTQQVGYCYDPTTGKHALLWNGSADSFIDLTPSGFGAAAWGTNGTQQVGDGSGSATGGKEHALLWNGSSDSYVDLNPSWLTESYGRGISGSQQVGFGYGPNTGALFYYHALLWSGTAASCVDLNPSGFNYSRAWATNGAQQVGHGYVSSISDMHALLWSGTAASCVDLNPSGFASSYAYGIYGTQQVGHGDGHALLWSGTAASYVDLNPSGYYSCAWGTNGTQQVGYGSGSATGNNEHALVWNGSADNYIDLHQFLPSGFVESYAYRIDSYGNIVGWAEYGSVKHAILWQLVPEPATLSILALGSLALLRKRKN